MIKKYEDFLDLVIYQIYPRSFYDSNNDGIGDIPGVIEKLDYLKDLGINAIWLCPCYKSPNHDNGYDISDYRDIMDEFGTLDDIKRLISEMNRRDMKLIMDLVPNHTSNEHKWFIESRKSKDNPYSDYYYWVDEPLNDWGACFGGSAWQYDDSRKQYYLHSYTPYQPDLNWTNPKVVKEMQDIIDFWVDLGVSGFRCDVIDQISKDFENNVNAFGPHLHEYINALFGRKEVEHLFTVGECWANEIEEVKRHISDDRGELSTLFQFEHTERCGRSSKWVKTKPSLKEFRDILVKWQALTQKHDILYSLFTDNHDQSYFLSRAGNDKELRYESATCIAAMLYLLKGVPFIYQGQEFGSAAPYYKDMSYFNDVSTFDFYETALKEGMSKDEVMKRVNFGSRDNTRRPMMWNNSKYGGFSDAEPWLPVNSRLQELNLENDLQSEKSIHDFYKNLLKLRKEYEAFRRGELEVLSKQENDYFIFKRYYKDECFIIICNFEEESTIPYNTNNYDLVLTNYKNKSNTQFKPYEVAVYKKR